MKASILLLACILILVFSAGCAQNRTPGTTPGRTSPAVTQSPGATNPATVTPDAATGPSVAIDDATLVKAMGAEGTWIIILTDDLSTEHALVLDGKFTNGKKDTSGKDIIQRKIALYTQDANRNITKRFTLTAPKLTINSPMASIQHGTFMGDIYVSAENFELVDTTVDGNMYFSTDAAKNTFKMDDQSKITGKQEVQK